MTQLEFKFVIPDMSSRDVAWQWLQRDMRSAQLSPAYRAYYHLRPLIPLPLRQMLQRYRYVTSDDSWYIPREFIDELTQRMHSLEQPLSLIHPWPQAASFAMVLTHDVETAAGLRMIGQIADLEEGLGFRSSWNFVPYQYQIDQGLVRDLRSRSFEIGIHGFNHDGRLFSSQTQFQRRLPAINAAIRQFDASGFRAPMVHRNLQWMQELEIQYDSSCFDIDPFQPMPGGVGSMWPFRIGRFIELPYTLPQDHTLLIASGQTDGSAWREKLDYIIRHQGMALMLTHPDYLCSENRLAIYRDFLVSVRDRGDYWHALPREVASWWQRREDSTLELDSTGAWAVCGPAREEAVPAVLKATKDGFRFASSLERKAATTSHE